MHAYISKPDMHPCFVDPMLASIRQKMLIKSSRTLHNFTIFRLKKVIQLRGIQNKKKKEKENKL